LETIGLITNAQSASFKSDMARYLEDTTSYLVELEANNLEAENGYEEGAKKYFYAGDTTTTGNLTYKQRFLDISTLVGTDKIQNTDWEVFTDMSNQEHRTHLAVEEGNLTWFADDASDIEVQWCLELGIKVFVIGKGFITESGNYQTGSSGNYGNTIGDSTELVPSGVWCNAPDLSTGWNTGATYYISYSSLEDEGTIGNLIYKDVPSAWYDYGTGKWANVATVSNGQVSYWTWVPRYMVKVTLGEVSLLDGTSGADGSTDVKFVDMNNEWTGSDGTKMNKTELQTAGYVLPDAFTFDGKDLKGIWVAKYEVSDPAGVKGFGVKSGENYITITSLTYTGNNFSSIEKDDIRLSKLDIKVNGSIYKYTDPTTNEVITGEDVVLGSEGFTLYGLSPDTEYVITVIIKSKYMKEMNLETTKTVKTTKGGMKPYPAAGETDIVEPDLTGFSLTNTFYATINSSNQLVKGDPISEDPPTDWYDYGNNKYANIMTLNTSVDSQTGLPTEHNGDMAVWVWIPRYEYKIDNELRNS